MKQQIEKVFGSQLLKEKKQNFNQEYLKKSLLNNYLNQEKKISNKKNININYQDDRSPISNKLKNNFSFYFDINKKIKENEKEKNLSNINIKTQKNKKHLFTKPGFKKERSQGNLLSKNFFDGKKELEINKNSKIKNSQSPKNRTKINNKRYNIFFDDKKNSKIIEIKQMETQNNSIINNLNLNNKNKNQFLLKNNYIGLNSENEKIEKIVQFQIINKYKKFDILQVENVIYGQILKNADFSNVKKLDLNYKKDNFNNFNSNINSNSDIKITDNVINHPEINYQVPNNVLTQKKNNIFCCF